MILRLASLVAAALTAAGAVAHAEPSRGEPPANVLVLEAYAGRPSDAEVVMAPVLTTLRQEDVLTGAAAKEIIEARISLPAPAAPVGDFVKASEAVDRGYDAYIDGNYAAAISFMEPAIATFVAHPLEARDGKVRDEHFRALAVLAASQLRTGASDPAVSTMIEVLRTFPDRPVALSEFPPDVVKVYRDTRSFVRPQRTGTLVVRVNDPTSVLFVNEVFAGLGQVTLRELLPGTYRVFVLIGQARGRLHRVTVHRDTETRLDLDARLETTLRTDELVGLVFPDDAALVRDEGRLGVRIGREIGVDSVVILSIREITGIRAVVGSVFNVASGALVRRGVMALEPVEPSPDKLRLLGQYLRGDPVLDPSLHTGTQEIVLARPPAGLLGRGAQRRQRIIALSTAGAGVASLGAGLALGLRASSKWKESRPHCPGNVCNEPGRRLVNSADTAATLSNITVGLGLVAIAGGAVLWLTASEPEPSGVQIVPMVGPSHAGAVFRAAF